MVNAVAERGALSAPGFDRSAAQPAWGWLPGCSGNVVPGTPGSARAGPAVSASTAMLRPVVVIRFIAPPWMRWLLLMGGAVVPSGCRRGVIRSAIQTFGRGQEPSALGQNRANEDGRGPQLVGIRR